MKDIAIVGAGGLGREVTCLIKKINQHSRDKWNLIGFFDDAKSIGIDGVIGTSDDLNSWPTPLDIAIAIGNPASVKKIVSKIKNPLIDFPNIIAPDVILYEEPLKIGKGNIITFGCHISCNVTIGDYNIFNIKVSIGHDVFIGKYNAVMPAVCISGNITIGDENFFGVGSMMLQGIRIGQNIRLGAGSVLMRSTKDNNLYMGNPAKIIKL